MKISIRKKLSCIFQLSLFVFLPIQSPAQNTHFFFPDGEKLEFDIKYNWGFIWIDAGTVYFETKHVKKGASILYHFKSEGKSASKYEWIYKVNNLYESVFDPHTNKSLWFERKTEEGKKIIKNTYRYFAEQNSLFCVQNTGKIILKDTLLYTPKAYDLLTATYIMRAVDFSTAKANDRFNLTVIADGKFQTLTVTYKGKQYFTENNKNIRAHLFSSTMIENQLIKGGESLKVWVSDDEKKDLYILKQKLLLEK